MPDTTLGALKKANNDLFFKALDAVVLVAPITATIPAAFTTGASAALQSLPAEYRSIGWVDDSDAYTWSRDTEIAETTSHGSTEPTRRDIRSDVTGFQMTAQETSRLVLELSHNVDLSSVTPTPVTGELTFNRALSPQTRYFRLIAIAQDGAGDDLRYNIVVLPRAMVSEYGETSWSAENIQTFPLTWSATPDPVLQFSYRQTYAGPGIRSRLEKMGFPALAP
ncbi:MAG: hypothetical protein AVDCRST_MAG68-5037 [uncultured Gemmatimonadetes bacterium]|uniref:Uncharacterized protein n=1 Tax=uncultured Gemmatimonadota bacterium TaxID=203437 RepID=A0A6J4MNI7_9BACT|nr:MAG: hypothetical protein AVDCRST_MAG68-5037 [uncultured Gemmatimonadota bacterium]